jgi:hypothetical protein
VAAVARREDAGAEGRGHGVGAEADRCAEEVGAGVRDVRDPVVAASACPDARLRVQAGGRVHARAGAAYEHQVRDVEAACRAGAHDRPVRVAQQGESGVPVHLPQLAYELTEFGCRFLGQAGGEDVGADRAGRLVAEPGDHRGAWAEPLVQGEGSRAEAVVRVQACVGAGHEDRHVVGLRQVAEDLGGSAGAAGVEGEEVARRVRHGADGGRSAAVAVGRGHARGLGGVRPVRRVGAVQRGGGHRAGVGRGGCRYLRVGGRGGDRGDEGAGDQSGEEAATRAGAGPSGAFARVAWLDRMVRLVWLAWLACRIRMVWLARLVCLACWNRPVCVAWPGRSSRSCRSPPP